MNPAMRDHLATWDRDDIAATATRSLPLGTEMIHAVREHLAAGDRDELAATASRSLSLGTEMNLATEDQDDMAATAK